jgi:hypothetical protein
VYYCHSHSLFNSNLFLYVYFFFLSKFSILFQIYALSSLGLIEHFSAADRKIADWFMLTMTTGFPWGSGVDSRLQVSRCLKIFRNLLGIRVRSLFTVRPLDNIIINKNIALILWVGTPYRTMSSGKHTKSKSMLDIFYRPIICTDGNIKLFFSDLDLCYYLLYSFSDYRYNDTKC